ncbi:MAG TPA: hypothetical protein VGP06_15185 [Janthinobacterium sp.]|nr:hypothetical protein [Janthinobacterium sp.]
MLSPAQQAETERKRISGHPDGCCGAGAGTKVAAKGHKPTEKKRIALAKAAEAKPKAGKEAEPDSDVTLLEALLAHTRGKPAPAPLNNSARQAE